MNAHMKNRSSAPAESVKGSSIGWRRRMHLRRTSAMLRRFGTALAAAFLVCLAAAATASAATVGPTLQAKLAGLADSASAGIVIVAFNTDNGLQPEHLAVLTGLGITAGTTLPTLGMVAVPATAGQARALAANPAVRSVWSNDQL